MTRGWWIGVAAAALLAMGPPLARADDPKHEYVAIGKCGKCHGKELYGDQVSAWRKGEHSGALDSLASEKALEYARKKGIAGPPQDADECLECHVTAHGVNARFIKYDLDPKDGVQCESCHGPGADYRKKSVMSDRDMAITKGMLPQSAEVCTTCHNDRSPAWDPARYTLADGSHTGFDYEQAVQNIRHPVPEERRGKIVEIEKEMKARGEKIK
jgi:hypothetical protein